MQPRLCGLEWQSWANQLLTLYYGPDEYQKVPDGDRGDAGIEGFTLKEGHAYQAYGCVEPIGVKKRYEEQRDKITEDLGKFIKNKAKLIKLFGNVKITRWILFVPFHDSKELVSHATKKTSEVIDAKLEYVCPTFQVKIADEDQFSVQRDALTNIGLNQVDVEVEPESQEAIEKWASENDGLVATLDRKVGLLPTIKTDAARLKYRDQMLHHFVEGQKALEYLRVCSVSPTLPVCGAVERSGRGRCTRPSSVAAASTGSC